MESQTNGTNVTYAANNGMQVHFVHSSILGLTVGFAIENSKLYLSFGLVHRGNRSMNIKPDSFSRKRGREKVIGRINALLEHSKNQYGSPAQLYIDGAVMYNGNTIPIDEVSTYLNLIIRGIEQLPNVRTVYQGSVICDLISDALARNLSHFRFRKLTYISA